MESQPSRSTIIILKLIAAAGLALLVWMLSGVLLMIFAAILVAIAYRGSAEWISRRTGMPIGWSLALVAVVFVAFVAGTAWWTGGTLLDQLGPALDAACGTGSPTSQCAARHRVGQRLAGYLKASGC